MKGSDNQGGSKEREASVGPGFSLKAQEIICPAYSNDSYISGIGAFGALGGFEFNLVTFLQGFEPLPRDCRMVNKHILPSVHFNKSKALLIVEPLYSSF